MNVLVKTIRNLGQGISYLAVIEIKYLLNRSASHYTTCLITENLSHFFTTSEKMTWT